MKKIYKYMLIAGLLLLSPAIFASGNISSLIISDLDGNKIDVIKESYSQPVIVVRYLGASCSKCLHQLNILNAMSENLKKQNIKVIGFSNDDAVQTRKILKQAKYVNSVVNLYCDTEGKASEIIGSTIDEINGEKTELHATLLIYKGQTLFSDIDAKPFMQISKITDKLAALNQESKN